MSETIDFYRQLHADRKGTRKEYGSTGGRNGGPQVRDLLNSYNGVWVKSHLDYGCGNGSLTRMLKAEVRPDIKYYEYDPAIPGKDTLPVTEVDMISCLDVLEHVEPDQIDDVLSEIFGLARRSAYLLIACDPCGITMPDGRNAHLIQEGYDWWAYKISEHNTGWELMYGADVLKRKRSGFRRHCEFHLERKGA
jgi:hypothetical protein